MPLSITMAGREVAGSIGERGERIEREDEEVDHGSLKQGEEGGENVGVRWKSKKKREVAVTVAVGFFTPSISYFIDG